MIELKKYIEENLEQRKEVVGWKEDFLSVLNDVNGEYYIGEDGLLYVFDECEETMAKTTVEEMLDVMLTVEEGYVDDANYADEIKVFVVGRIIDMLSENSIKGLMDALEHYCQM